VVRVRDSGIGIRPESLATIFELFAQIDRTLDRTQGGLGVGLTLVQRLVELHGGSVHAFSDGPGRGSEFVVRLPLRTGTTVSESDSDRSHPERKSAAGACRILLVEDNADSAHTMAALLSMEGHETAVVYDGDTALQRAQAMAPDVVLVDIGLPGMDGFQVARELRARPQTRGALLIAVTGYGQAADRQSAMEAGFDHHLVKPVDLNAVQKLLVTRQEREA